MKFPKIVLTETDKPVNESLREGAASAVRGVADVIEHPTHIVTKPKAGLAKAINWLADTVEPDKKPKRKRRARRTKAS